MAKTSCSASGPTKRAHRRVGNHGNPGSPRVSARGLLLLVRSLACRSWFGYAWHMTEDEWTNSESINDLFAFLTEETSGRVHRFLSWVGLRAHRTSVRKLQMFCAACCRTNPIVLRDAEYQADVARIEEYADGAVPRAAVTTLIEKPKICWRLRGGYSGAPSPHSPAAQIASLRTETRSFRPQKAQGFGTLTMTSNRYWGLERRADLGRWPGTVGQKKLL